MRAALRRAASSVEDNGRWLTRREGLFWGPEGAACPTETAEPPLAIRFPRLRFTLMGLREAFLVIWQYDSMVSGQTSFTRPLTPAGGWPESATPLGSARAACVSGFSR